jgi:DNA anti-recombination protein RmuC
MSDAGAHTSSKPAPEAVHTRPRRRWLTVGLVAVGLVAVALVGHAVGDNSRDDDVKAAEAQAQQADQQAAKAQKELEQEQAQDEEALQALSQGLQQLGSAIEQQDAQDDQASQDAVDEAAAKIRGDLEQLGTETRADVDTAVSELQQRINDAVGSRGAESAPEGGP